MTTIAGGRAGGARLTFQLQARAPRLSFGDVRWFYDRALELWGG